MHTPAVTAAPVLATIAAAGWLVWSQLGTPIPTLTVKENLVKIDASLLAPRLGVLAARDPFRLPGETPPVKPVIAAQSTAAKPPTPGAVGAGARPPAGSQSAAPDVGAVRSGRVAALVASVQGMIDKANRSIAEQKTRAKEVHDALNAKVRLSAIAIRGESRMAVLNGRMVNEGDTLPGLGSPKEPVVLARVRASSVMLVYRGIPEVVNFPSIATATGSYAASPAPPREGSAKPKARQARRPSRTRP